LSTVAGLVLGIATAALVLGGLVALTPVPTAPSTPAPASSPTAIPSVVVSAAPIASLAPDASRAPSASPSPSPPGGSASAPGTAAFHVGHPAPAPSVPKVGGTIDLILPGVDVTP
jgi:hypothetical protein